MYGSARNCTSALLTFQNSQSVPVLASHAQKIVQEMCDYVHRNFHNPFSLGEVASTLKMNPAYLSSLFSHTMGMTFHQYLDEYRLSKAKELLCDPLKRIDEIANAVGYASPDYFRHAFRAHTDLSPSDWRKGQ